MKNYKQKADTLYLNLTETTLCSLKIAMHNILQYAIYRYSWSVVLYVLYVAENVAIYQYIVASLIPMDSNGSLIVVVAWISDPIP